MPNLNDKNPDKSSELLPCAHCGSKNVRHVIFEFAYTASSIVCDNCNVSTDTEYGEYAAIPIWNTRAAPKPSGEVVLSLTRGELALIVNTISMAIAHGNAWKKSERRDLLTVIRSQTKDITK